jgi:hypothetical protein
MRHTAVVFALFCTLGVSGAAAEISIESTGWEIAIKVNPQGKDFHRIEQWLFPPGSLGRVRLRAVVRLRNRETLEEKAVLLRYAVSARLRRIGGRGPGVWAVPFIKEERHVPAVQGATTMLVPLPINSGALSDYLGRQQRGGFWPDALRLMVMIEPRKGEALDGKIKENDLAIAWSTRPGSGE